MSMISRSLLTFAAVLHRIIGLAGLIAVLIVINLRRGTTTGAAPKGDIP
jgi:hypothetical protein